MTGGAFPNPVWLRGLDTDESRAPARALPVLRDARSRIGREPTAALLDDVWTRLGWRPLVAAGPDGDHGLAQLDLIADLVRATEASAVDPCGVLDALEPGEQGEADLPKVRLAGEGPTVEVTTIFSAKGLEYDHVALPQDVFDAMRRRDRNLVDHLRVAGKGVLAVHVDPRGALKPRKDPWTLWVGACDAAERTEEQWRLLYVGLTRARQSVTLGLGATGKGAGTGDQQRLALGVDAQKHQPDEPLRPVEGLLAVRTDEEAIVLPAHPPHVPVRPRTARALDPRGSWEPTVGRRLRSPSRWAEGQQDGGALVRAMRQTASIEVADGAPDLPFPVGLPERRRGDVVHTFLEHWAFRGDPDPDACARFLRERWRHDDPALATALCALGRHLLTALPGLRSLIEGATLHFEAPVVAAVSTPHAPGGEDILLGRVDLLVEHPDGAVSVLDLKAGSHFAQVSDDGGADIPGLSAYAWQLHRYREALAAAGRPVRTVGRRRGRPGGALDVWTGRLARARRKRLPRGARVARPHAGRHGAPGARRHRRLGGRRRARRARPPAPRDPRPDGRRLPADAHRGWGAHAGVQRRDLQPRLHPLRARRGGPHTLDDRPLGHGGHPARLRRLGHRLHRALPRHVRVRVLDALERARPMPDADDDTIAAAVLAELRTAVQLRKESDVPVGVFLSGGIDSSTNAALFQEGESRPVRTFTIGYQGGNPSYPNEVEWARRMAEHVGAEHHELLLGVDDLVSFLLRMAWLQDEPIADPVCVPLYYVSKLARDAGVIVTQVGEGADELFWGHDRWKRSLEGQLRFDRAPQLPGARGLVRALRHAPRLRDNWRSEWLDRAARGVPIFWGGAGRTSAGGKTSTKVCIRRTPPSSARRLSRPSECAKTSRLAPRRAASRLLFMPGPSATSSAPSVRTRNPSAVSTLRATS